MAETTRVLIVDDHPSFRAGLRALIESVPGLEVAGEAGSGQEAIRRAAILQPHVILMDIQMPQMNGIEATRQIFQASPHIGVIVLTMFEDDDSVFAAMRAGARGYLLKGAGQEEILRAIRAVCSGEALFGPGIARRLISFFGRAAARQAEPFPQLTGREREILELLARGLTNTAIAGQLYLSPKTVRNQVSIIFDKLQVADRAEAIIRAREAGLGK